MALFNKKTDNTVKGTEEKSKDVEAKSMKELYNKPETQKSSKADGKSKKSIRANTRAFRILVKPLITEKGTALASLGKYVFEVSDDANKIEVSKAIEDLYGVKPLKVNIVCMEGKLKARGRVIGKRKDWKKAVVTLTKGQTIDVYEGV